jgi:hypothetical protein
MRRVVMLLSLLTTLSPAALGGDKKLVKVKVEVVEQEGLQGSIQGGGLVGDAIGRRVITDAWTMKVIVNGEHALLRCYENHDKCHFLGVGTYEAELKTHAKEGWTYGGAKYSDPELWIHYIRPIDHVAFREHWKVDGSW